MPDPNQQEDLTGWEEVPSVESGWEEVPSEQTATVTPVPEDMHTTYLPDFEMTVDSPASMTVEERAREIQKNFFDIPFRDPTKPEEPVEFPAVEGADQNYGLVINPKGEITQRGSELLSQGSLNQFVPQTPIEQAMLGAKPTQTFEPSTMGTAVGLLDYSTYIPRRFVSGFEQSAWATVEGILRSVNAIYKYAPDNSSDFSIKKDMKTRRIGRANAWIEYYNKPEVYGVVTPQAEAERAMYSKAAYQSNFLLGLTNDFMETAVDFTAFIAQLGLFGGGASKASMLAGKLGFVKDVALESFKTLVPFALATTKGGLKERVKSAATLWAFGMVNPIIGLTGSNKITATALSTALNSVITSPEMIQMYREAGGFNQKFFKMFVPLMAWNIMFGMWLKNTPGREYAKFQKQFHESLVKAVVDPDRVYTPREIMLLDKTLQKMQDEAQKAVDSKPQAEVNEIPKEKIDIKGPEKLTASEEELRQRAMESKTEEEFISEYAGKLEKEKERLNTEAVMQAIDETSNTMEELGLITPDIQIVNETKIIDPSLPENKAILAEHGYTEKEIADAEREGKVFIITGEHDLPDPTLTLDPNNDQVGVKVRRSIRLFHGHTPEDVYHEVAHEIEAQGGLAGWAGTPEQHAKYIEDLWRKKKHTELVEFQKATARNQEILQYTRELRGSSDIPEDQIKKEYRKKVEEEAQEKNKRAVILRSALEFQKELDSLRAKGEPLMPLNEQKKWFESNVEYLKSVDPDLLCQKSEGADIAVNRLKTVLGAKYESDLAWDVFARAAAKGLQVPCPQCYVFWARKKAGKAMQKKFLVGIGGYSGDLLRLKGTTLQGIMERGLRHYSSTDFKAEHIPGLMVEFAHAEKNGVPISGYTKDFDFINMFAPADAYINISLGRNERIGANYEKAVNMRKKFKNVSTVYVAFNDNEIMAMIRDPNIDHIIPWHASGAKLEDMQKIIGKDKIQDYTAVQSERYIETGKNVKDPTKKSKKGIPPERLYASDLLGMPVDDKIHEIEHGGDLETYLALVEERGFIKKFEHIYDMLGKDEKHLYMKLIGPEYGKFQKGRRDLGGGKLYLPPNSTKINRRLFKDIVSRRLDAIGSKKAYIKIADDLIKEVRNGTYEKGEVVIADGELPMERDLADRIRKAKTKQSVRQVDGVSLKRNSSLDTNDYMGDGRGGRAYGQDIYFKGEKVGEILYSYKDIFQIGKVLRVENVRVDEKFQKMGIATTAINQIIKQKKLKGAIPNSLVSESGKKLMNKFFPQNRTPKELEVWEERAIRGEGQDPFDVDKAIRMAVKEMGDKKLSQSELEDLAWRSLDVVTGRAKTIQSIRTQYKNNPRLYTAEELQRIYRDVKPPPKPRQGKPKDINTLYEYYAKQAGIDPADITKLIEHLSGNAQGQDLANEWRRLNEEYIGKKVRTPEGLGVIAGDENNKFQVKTKDGIKEFSYGDVEFLRPLASMQDAIDSLQKKAEAKVRRFLGSKIKELEDVIQPPVVEAPVTAAPVQEPTAVPIKQESRTEGGILQKESMAWKKSKIRNAEILRNELLDEDPRQELWYDVVNAEKDAEAGMDFAQNYPEEAKKIAYGMTDAPKGIRAESIAIAYSQNALERGDTAEFVKAERARSIRQTIRGQEIQTEARFSRNSPIKFIKDAINAKIVNRVGGDSSKVKAKLKSEVMNLERKLKGKEIDAEEAQKIIDSIIC